MLSSLLQAQNIAIRSVPSLNKLPVNAIHRIFQDSDGYMWYGTFNGLCRYDGYNILTFRSDFNNPELLKDNYITYIVEDHQKKIWFGTTQGAYILDKATLKITPVDMGDYMNENVFTINVTNDGTIWINVRGALLRYNPDGSLMHNYKIEYNNKPEYVYIVYDTKEGDILVSIASAGLYRLDKKTDKLEAYFHNPDYRYIERIIWDDTHKCYWLGTWGKGIVRFDPQQEDAEKQYVAQPLPVDILGNETGGIFHMVQDDILHYIWITTEKNIFAFRITEDGTLSQVNTSNFLPQGNKILYEIIKDKDGKLWVSSFDTNSFIIDIRKFIQKEYPLRSLKTQIKATPFISSLCLDDNNVVWFSQQRYGLCTYDLKTDEIRHFSECDNTKYLPFEEVVCLLKSQDSGKIWAMPYGRTIYALRQENLEMKVEERINLPQNATTQGTINSMYEDINGNLWIGTVSDLWVYDTQSKELVNVSNGIGHISAITETMDGKVWIATKNQGLYSIDAKLKTQSYAFDKGFICMDATSDGKLWLGTSKGEILLFDSADNELTDFSLACGMKGDIINNVIVDKLNHLWIVTNHMIKEYNPANSAYRVYNTRNEDFLIKRLFPQAVFYNQNDEIYFGGISGIVSIPITQQLEGIPEQVNTYITNVLIMGKSILSDNQLSEDLSQPLEIAPDAQNLKIEFSSLDFHNLDQIRYAYRLVGVEDDWIYLDEGKNSAFYNKLSKGSYIFQVKASDKNGLWSSEVTELKIDRLPAWYESWVAYLFYFLIATGVLTYSIYIYLKRMERRSGEKWSDSAELVKMHNYVESNNTTSTPDFAAVDQLLIDKIRAAVIENLEEPKFNVEKLAEAMNMSRSTLSRKIKLITGKTSFDFIKEIKMHHACKMLENKTATVTEVMLTLGYSDYKNFTESFKRIYGITPSEYQKKHTH